MPAVKEVSVVKEKSVGGQGKEKSISSQGKECQQSRDRVSVVISTIMSVVKEKSFRSNVNKMCQ